MKRLLLFIIAVVSLLLFPNINFGQAIILGPDASKFIIFTFDGAIGDNASAHSHLTGDVGYKTSGAFTGFGNVNGVMHPGVDAATTACGIDLLATIAQINATAPTLFPPSGSLGNGVTFIPGVYSVAGDATLSLDLILDAQNDVNAQFIIKIGGTFGANVNSKVKLINGAKACNVFWLTVGDINMASLVTMRGNVISGGLINMGSLDSLEGRMFCTVGAITLDGITAFTPQGCGSQILTGPKFPDMGSTACYTIFSSDGALTNSLPTSVIGDVGNNGIGAITGWDPSLVTGTLHLTQDTSTIQCAIDLSKLYDTLNAMVPDIELLYPEQFGHDLVLTPHVYVMNAAAIFTDSIYLDAQGNADGVFVIKIIAGSPALTTSTYSMVKLINGAQAKNVFWLVKGAVSINNYSVFRGNIVVPNGAINLVNTGVVLDGRALTMVGAITTEGLTAIMPPGCGVPPTTITTEPNNQSACAGGTASFTVVASGSGLTYQWRRGNVNLVNGGNIFGATTATLTINPVNASDTASNYNVIVFGNPNDTSINVSLHLNAAPIITTQPVNQVACLGGSVTFSVVASGTGLIYQWRKGTTNILNSATVSGATTASMTINPVSFSDTAVNYNVLITGDCAPDDSSDFVVLLIGTAPIITAEPINQAVCIGSPVNFSVIATGSGLVYQWRKGLVPIINGGNILGATSATLVINPVNFSDTASNYNVIISGFCTPNDSSIYVSLGVDISPTILTEPISQAVCAGDSVSFFINATGLVFQWRKGNVPLVNGGNISGATSNTLTINPVNIGDTASNYNIIVAGNCANNDTSVYVSLAVNAVPIIISEPVNQTSCTGSSVSFSVAATGTGITYQWRKGNVPLFNGGSISGATSATLTINPVNVSDTASNYNVVIMGVCASNDTSINVFLKVNIAPSIMIEPLNQISCAGSSASFTVIAAGTGLTYQWRNGTINLINGGNISGATSSTLVINPVNIADTASNYNVIVTGICGSNDTSINMTLGVLPIPTLDPVANQVLCNGVSTQGILFSGSVAGTTYNWVNDNSTIGLASSGTGNINSFIAINTGNASAIATITVTPVSNGCFGLSSVFTIIVNTGIITPAISSNSPICASNAINLNTPTVVGASYNWTGPNGFVSTSQNPVVLSATPTMSGVYSLILNTASGCSSSAVTTSVIVNAIPFAEANSTSPICAGNSIVLLAQTVLGATYSWTGPNEYSSSVQNSVILSASDLNEGIYTLVVSTNGCSSDPARVNVIVANCNTDLSVVKTVDNSTPFIGSTIVFTVTATNNGPGDATGVTVSDMLQSGYIYVSSVASAGSYDASTGIWVIGTLNNGAVATLAITVKVYLSGIYTNTATIFSMEIDPIIVNNTTTIETYPKAFFIPEGFSPNSDGINDLFVIRGIEYYPDNTFVIFNRWGDKVFEASPYLSNWNGKSNMGFRAGEDALPIGTYFYLLNLGDGSNVYKGTIYLNR